MSMPRDPNQVGEQLRRLRAECARLAEALLVGDDHGGAGHTRQLRLGASDAAPRPGAVVGETARAWQDLQWRIMQLGAQLAAVQQLLDRVATRHEHRPLAELGATELTELAALLDAPVEVVLTGVTGAPAEIDRLPVPEVLALATGHHAAVMTLATTVTEARAGALDQLRPATERLAVLRGGLDAVGAPATVIADLEAELDALRATAERDPLGAAHPAWHQHRDRLLARLGQVAARVERAESLRRELPVVIGELRLRIGRLDADETETRQAWTGLSPLPGDPATAELLPRAGELRDRLRAVERSCRQGRWWEVAVEEATAQIGVDVTAASAAAARARIAAGGHRRRLEELRVELRGRLEAFRHKAFSLGRSEDLVLAGYYTEAKQLLRTSPFEAVAADRAVWRYQNAVNTPPAAPAGPNGSERTGEEIPP